MEVNKKIMRNNRIWIEITNQQGFLMFGDLTRYQIKEGIKIGNNEADLICDNCPHKLRFKKENIEGKGRIWDWWKWRVFLRGNQISKSDLGYYAKLRVEFYCTHCQDDLPPKMY